MTDWKNRLGPELEFLLLLAGMNLIHLVARTETPKIMAEQLKGRMNDMRAGPALAGAKIAMAEYDHDEFEKAVSIADEAVGLCLKALDGPLGRDKNWKPILVESLLDSHQWKAEACRMLGRMDTAVRTAKEGLAHGFRGVRKRRLIRFRADLRCVLGECLINLGDLPKALKQYERAGFEYKRAAEMNWFWYAKFGAAEILKIIGELKEANTLLKKIKIGASSVGWRGWIQDQLDIAIIDLYRVRDGHLSAKDRTILTKIIENSSDENQRIAARELEMAFSWLEQEDFDPASICTDYETQIREFDDDPDSLPATKLSYAEFLKYIGRLDEALTQIISGLEMAEAGGYRLHALHCRTVEADIQRMRGQTPVWEELAHSYSKLGCRIGQMYAYTIGHLCGGTIDTRIIDQQIEYANENGLRKFSGFFPKSKLKRKNRCSALVFLA